jgi:hypothetical protein
VNNVESETKDPKQASAKESGWALGLLRQKLIPLPVVEIRRLVRRLHIGLWRLESNAPGLCIVQ